MDLYIVPFSTYRVLHYVLKLELTDLKALKYFFVCIGYFAVAYLSMSFVSSLILRCIY